MNYYNAHTDNLDSLYPEIYNELFPLIVTTADEIARRGNNYTNEIINSAVDNIIKTSGMWDEDEDYAAQAQTGTHYPYGRPVRRFRRRYHNRHTLRDVTRILLLRELFGRRNYHR